jgi:hypothetical protein
VDEVSLEASAASPAPVLGIQLSGENAALLYWPVSTSVFRLQQTAALNPASWTDTTNTVNPVNGTNQVLLAPTAPTQFYRLVYP